MNVLCVVAHPDDETLGCGGTLAKHAEAGDSIHVLALCACDRVAEFQQSVRMLGKATSEVSHELQPEDQMFDRSALKWLITIIERWKADVVYTHWPHDLNLDHSLTAKAVLTAFRAPHSQADILAFETLSSTEFGPEAFTSNHWESLTRVQLDRKIAALDCYPSEVKDRPHPRNAEGIMVQARWRGQQVCQEYAEAFQVLRSIR